MDMPKFTRLHFSDELLATASRSPSNVSKTTSAAHQPISTATIPARTRLWTTSRTLSAITAGVSRSEAAT